MTAAQMRTLDTRSLRAFPGLPTVLPVGAWVLTEDGELQVQDNGTVLPRPTPFPWSRPSIAAVPTASQAGGLE